MRLRWSLSLQLNSTDMTRGHQLPQSSKSRRRDPDCPGQANSVIPRSASPDPQQVREMQNYSIRPWPKPKAWCQRTSGGTDGTPFAKAATNPHSSPCPEPQPRLHTLL